MFWGFDPQTNPTANLSVHAHARTRARSRTKHLDFHVVSSLYADNSPQFLSSAMFSKEVDRQDGQLTRHYSPNGDVCTHRGTGGQAAAVDYCVCPLLVFRSSVPAFRTLKSRFEVD